jgi:hypothetical protein
MKELKKFNGKVITNFLFVVGEERIDKPINQWRY